MHQRTEGFAVKFADFASLQNASRRLQTWPRRNSISDLCQRQEDGKPAKNVRIRGSNFPITVPNPSQFDRYLQTDNRMDRRPAAVRATLQNGRDRLQKH